MSRQREKPGLMQALGFTADDLNANRQGVLSEAQKDRLRRFRRRQVLVGVVIVVAFSLIATTLLYFGQVNESAILSLIGIAVTACTAALLGVLARNALRLSSDLMQAQVQTVSGPLTHTIRVSGRTPTYFVKVGAEEFNVSKDVFLALDENAVYRLYRAPVSRMLLAAERV